MDTTGSRTGNDPYIGYTRRFFRKWVPVYDLFAGSIAPVYAAAARRIPDDPQRTVIDICCGTGEMTVRCARRGSPVVAVDVTREMLEKARRKADGLPVQFLELDARRLPFADRTFDTAVLSMALHDMPRRVRFHVLREAKRVTRSRLVVMDYDFPAAAALRRPLIAAVNLFESAYFRRFAETGLGTLLRDAGLADRIVERRRLPLFAVYTLDLDGAAPAGAAR
jgi:ubiquinone/menaquinone biosynthesis C-methylase UbiE